MKTFDYTGMREAFTGADLSMSDDFSRQEVEQGFYRFALLCHEANSKWWIDLKTGERTPRNYGQMVALFHSEVSEALEANRKSNRKDDKLPHRLGAEVELADLLIRIGDTAAGTDMAVTFSFAIKMVCMHNEDIKRDLDTESFPEKMASIHYEMSIAYHLWKHQGSEEKAMVHLARAVIKAIYVARQEGFDLYGAFVEKMEYNARREDHMLEHRKTQEGKKY